MLTVVISVLAGLAFRRRFPGSTFVFYLAVASLIMPGLLVGLGVGLTYQTVGLNPSWYGSALGAQLTWTLPFGLLIMFAVLSRFNRALRGGRSRPGGEQLADFLGWWWCRFCFPGMIAVALFGFTLSYDEFPRTLLTTGAKNTLPTGDLGHDHQRDLARAVCARNGDDAGLFRRHHPVAGLDRDHPVAAVARTAAGKSAGRVEGE